MRQSRGSCRGIVPSDVFGESEQIVAIAERRGMDTPRLAVELCMGFNSRIIPNICATRTVRPESSGACSPDKSST